MKIYASIIDQFLDDVTPDYALVGLVEAQKSGEKLLKEIHDETDTKFLDELVPIQLTASKDDWRNHSAKALSDDNILADLVISMGEAKGADVEKKELSDTEVKGYIKRLLNEGLEPVKVAARLDKLAELQLFNRQMGTDYLNEMSGTLGLVFLEPNSYMKGCPDSYKRMAKQGTIRAKSVKKISACEGCSYHKTASDKGETCGLYKLPIVAKQADLIPIINNLVGNVKNKKAELVKIANKENERVTPSISSSPAIRNKEKTSSKGLPNIHKNPDFSSSHIAKFYEKGLELEKISAFGVKQAGAVQAGKALKEFLGKFKRVNGNIAVRQADYKFLQKVGVHNLVVGDEFGIIGSIVSHPQTEKPAMVHKSASNPTDGFKLVTEYNLDRNVKSSDIELSNYNQEDIKMGSKFEVNI